MNSNYKLFISLLIVSYMYPKGGGHGGGHHGGKHHSSHQRHHTQHHRRNDHHGYHHGHHHYYGRDHGDRNFINWWWGLGLSWPYGVYRNRQYIYPTPMGYWGFRNITPYTIIVTAGKQRVALAPGDTADIQKTPNSKFTITTKNSSKPITFQSVTRYIQVLEDQGVVKIKSIK